MAKMQIHKAHPRSGQLRVLLSCICCLMSDRICIQTYNNETIMQTLVSDTDILACCGERCGHGCNGGYMTEAWGYVVNNGTCSGGPYLAKDCCKPYAFHPCGQHKGQPYYGECEKPNENTPTCRKRCQFHYKKAYEEDKIKVLHAYYVYGLVNEIAMQEELMAFGPFQAAFIVYDDFRYYKSGVYVHKYGKEAGGHAVKIIGWGVENEVKYWLVSNSWNSDWGDNGYFKILRGENECGIEGPGMAGKMWIGR
ncbi:unnamed protein product [Cylicocyclus nassatus]|uniref:Peptidase C1A papain C-terminal domain-containing protein n=1 Tax=Cylicocyclus nassatus TaxID=53992 RepID=A0AA36H7F1_CYLNA|nr:unnamed protein product [Cylicocyclus nassatus]